MAAPVWNAAPHYTAAQIAAAFGPGARIVRRGDGRYTVAGMAAAPAPAAAGAAAPVPPAPSPVSVERQSAIDSIGGRITALPDVFNPQRLSVYAEGARGLTDRGYFDTATADVAGTAADGSTTYKVTAGPDGQLYRDATNDTAAAANSQGMLFSSATREAQAARARDLTNARAAILRQLSSSQDDITRQQADQATGLRGDLNGAQMDYAGWRAQQPVPIPPAGPQTPAPAGPAGPNNPRSPAGRLASRTPGFRGFMTNFPRHYTPRR